MVALTDQVTSSVAQKHCNVFGAEPILGSVRLQPYREWGNRGKGTMRVFVPVE